MAREISHAGLTNQRFIKNATTGFEEFAASVESSTLEVAAEETGLDPQTICDAAHAYARADRAMICWTLGITEHHTSVDNVLALINLALLRSEERRVGKECRSPASPTPYNK